MLFQISKIARGRKKASEGCVEIFKTDNVLGRCAYFTEVPKENHTAEEHGSVIMPLIHCLNILRGEERRWKFRYVLYRENERFGQTSQVMGRVTRGAEINKGAVNGAT